MFFIYVLSGIIGGVIGGMGMGGGTLLIPLLTFWAGVEQHVAQAVNLIAFIPMSVVALVIHAKKGLLKVKTVFPVIFFGLISCAVGAITAGNLNGTLLKKLFGVFLIILSFFTFLSAIKRR